MNAAITHNLLKVIENVTIMKMILVIGGRNEKRIFRSNHIALFARKQINNKQGLIAQAKLNVWQYLNHSGVVMN